MIIFYKTLCNSLRLILKNCLLLINNFHDDCKLNLILIHINNVFETLFRFINIEKILKKSLLMSQFQRDFNVIDVNTF